VQRLRGHLIYVRHLDAVKVFCGFFHRRHSDVCQTTVAVFILHYRSKKKQQERDGLEMWFVI